MQLPFGFPSHPSSLLPFLISSTKKPNRNKSKGFSEWKQAHVGIEPSKTNQTRWKWHHNTFIPSYILCHFAKYAHHESFYMHLASSICIEWTRYSVLLTPVFHQSLSAMFSSSKISQHNLNSNLNSNIPYRPSTAHALQSYTGKTARPYLSCSV